MHYMPGYHHMFYTQGGNIFEVSGQDLVVFHNC